MTSPQLSDLKHTNLNTNLAKTQYGMTILSFLMSRLPAALLEWGSFFANLCIYRYIWSTR